MSGEVRSDICTCLLGPSWNTRCWLDGSAFRRCQAGQVTNCCHWTEYGIIRLFDLLCPYELCPRYYRCRLQRLKRLAAEHALERSNRFVGRVQEVLVEGQHDRDPSLVFGRNPHNKLVYFHGAYCDLLGKIVAVRIMEARPYSLVGEALSSDAEGLHT